MATIKSYTDIEQSKKLAEILPVESADMHWFISSLFVGYSKKDEEKYNSWHMAPVYWPSWSLTALLAVLPSAILDSSDDHHYRLYCMERFTEWYDNPIDACVAMIEKLHELKML